LNALEALCDYALYKSTFTLLNITLHDMVWWNCKEPVVVWWKRYLVLWCSKGASAWSLVLTPYI